MLSRVFMLLSYSITPYHPDLSNFIYAKNTSLYMFHGIVGASLLRSGNGKGEY